MPRNFSLGFKTPNWTNISIGVGKPLTDKQIAKYIEAGKYGKDLKLVRKTIPKHVQEARAVAKLVEEYL